MNFDTKMIRHRARKNDITLAALKLACRYVDPTDRITKKEAIRSIWESQHKRCRRRKSEISLAVAEQRFAEALPIARQVLADVTRGQRRREVAAVPAALSAHQRKAVAVRQIIGSPAAGGSYSGSTQRTIEYGEPAARTVTSYGDRYSSRCTWSRTDAHHMYRASLSGLLRVRAAGLPINCPLDRAVIIDATHIRTEPEGRIFAATVITEKNKSIELRDIVIADQGDGRIYFGKTERGCLMALRRSARSESTDPEIAGRVTQQKLSRRHGWCADGIREWCRHRGIHRDLQARLKKGTTRKALGRLLRKQNFTPATSYDNKVLAYVAE